MYTERKISIGNRELFVRVSGRGPCVVLNNGGGASGFGCWELIEKGMQGQATVICYDRAGLGGSDFPASPPTALDMVSDLKALLTVLDVTGPVVLIGWSLSALVVQLYACEYPDEVKGLILLDPTPDQFFSGFSKHPPAIREKIREAMLSNSPSKEEGLVLEIEKLPESCEQVFSSIEAKGLPNIPLVVMTAGKKTEIAAGVGVGGESLVTPHKNIAARSLKGKHLVAERSTHKSITIDDAELIIGQIKSMI